MKLTNKSQFSKISWPWTNVYGLARSLVACSTLLTLLFNNIRILINPTFSTRPGMISQAKFWASKFSLFTLLDAHLEIAKWIAIIVLITVIIGLYPKITGILHWYITISFFASVVPINGGDQIATILTFMFIPLTLTDPRRSHWGNYTKKEKYKKGHIGYILLCLIAMTTIWVIRLQVGLVYLWSGIAKLGVTQWHNGTALYYFFLNPKLVPLWERTFLMPLVENKVTALLLTWGVPIFEIFIGMCLFMTRKYWKPLLFITLVFHAAIILIFGLLSFFFSMAACLVIYFVPYDHEFELDAQYCKQKLSAISLTYKQILK